MNDAPRFCQTPKCRELGCHCNRVKKPSTTVGSDGFVVFYETLIKCQSWVDSAHVPATRNTGKAGVVMLASIFCPP